MTCLLPPAASQPDESGAAGDQGQALTLSLIGTALQQLRQLWREQGFDDAVFLAGDELQSSLIALCAAQKRELLVALLGLCEEPALFRPLQEALSSGVADPRAGRTVLRLLQQLQPVLSLWPMLSCYGGSPLNGSESRVPATLPALTAVTATRGQLQSDADAQSTDLWVLGISIRAMNALRRGGIHRIRQLVGLREEDLRGLRNMGDAGIEELRAALQQQGLVLPFNLQELRAVAPEAAGDAADESNTSDASAPPSPWGARPSWSPANTAARNRFNRPQPAPPIDEAEDQRWVERVAALIDASRPDLVEGPAALEHSQAEPPRNPARVLEEITSLTLEHYSGLPHRDGELQKLRGAFLAIDEAIAERRDLALQAEGLQGLLLESYRKRLSTANAASGWFKQLLRALSAPAATTAFLRNSAGEALETIGREHLPPITREAVRQSFRRLSDCCGASTRELAQRLQRRLEEQQRQQLQAALDPWLARVGRLPFDGDEPVGATGCPRQAEVVEMVCRLSLQQRLVLLRELGLPVTAAEWELHFQQLLRKESRPGTGYWEDIETLRQFLPRFAELLGQPDLMPLQTSLPGAIKGAVYRHGGQSAVAKALGLAYQGQLVGENGGRTYWTEARLHDLLAQTAAQAGLAADAMPDRPQITAFLSSGVVPEYLDKQANSVFAALSRQFSLSWPQVAERFGRRIIR